MQVLFWKYVSLDFTVNLFHSKIKLCWILFLIGLRFLKIKKYFYAK